MTTRLILVRHGESHHQLLGVAGGARGDTGLTETGRAQISRAGQRLANWPLARNAAVYTSTLPRAVQSGEIVAAAVGATVLTPHCGLCSYHVLDEYDGQPHSAEWAAAKRGSGMNLFRAELENGDYWGALVMRAAAAYHEIAEKHYGETAIIVTHNETIQASLIALGDLSFRNRLGARVAPASITEWATEGDTRAGGPADGWSFVDWRLVRLNDTGHLDP